MLSSSSLPIAAIATAPGKGGIGIVRISGRGLRPLAQALLAIDPKPRHAHYLAFRDTQGQPIDAGIALFFEAPHSYTGEDVLELQGHGGTAVLQRLLDHCLIAGRPFGLRHAEPGEFTRRAFLNDRMDLAQAEAVADLIDASSEAAARSAMASLSGAFSGQIRDLSERLVRLRMLVEATLDFPEEEIEFLEKYQVGPQLQDIVRTLRQLQQQGRQGMVLREGLHVVLAGRPNVGKSSLLNALAGDEIAIVTPVAGTTRDRIVQQIHLQGVPIHIVDTAGLRDTDDAVESLGIARTWQEVGRADLVLHLQDARAPDDGLDADIAGRLPPKTPVLVVRNKADLVDAPEGSGAADHAGASALAADSTHPAVGGDPKGRADDRETRLLPDTLYVSALTGDGLDALRQALLHHAGWSPGAESPWLARQRHLTALDAALAHVQAAAGHAAHDDQVLDLFAEELRLAHGALTEITGEFSSDDLLGEIFSRFCIGK